MPDAAELAQCRRQLHEFKRWGLTMRLSISALAISLALAPVVVAQNCDSNCMQRLRLERERNQQEANRQQDAEYRAMQQRQLERLNGSGGQGNAPPVPAAQPGLTQRDIAQGIAFGFVRNGTAALSRAIYDANLRAYFSLDKSTAEDFYLKKDLPTLSLNWRSDVLTMTELARFGALAGLANWDNSELLAASEGQASPEERKTTEALRKRAIDLLYTCMQWTASADCARILKTIVRERAEVLPRELPFTMDQLSAANVTGSEQLDWIRLGDLRQRWQIIYGNEATRVRAEAQRLAAEKRARQEAAARLEASRLPADQHMPLITRTLAIAKARVASAGFDLNLKAPLLREEWEPIVREVRAGLGAVFEGLDYGPKSLLRPVMPDGCSMEQPGSCSRLFELLREAAYKEDLALLDWDVHQKNREALYNLSRRLSLVACRDEPNPVACANVAYEYRALAKKSDRMLNQARAITYRAQACAGQIASPGKGMAGFECDVLAQWLEEDNDAAYLPLAIDYYRLACALGDKPACTTAIARQDARKPRTPVAN